MRGLAVRADDGTMHVYMRTDESGAQGAGWRPGPRELAAFRDLAMHLRSASWQVAVDVADAGTADGTLAPLAQLGTVRRLGNLPAFVGALASTLVRPRPGSQRPSVTNPVLARLARDHVVERLGDGYGVREVVREFLLLRRAMWRQVQVALDPTLDAPALLHLEDALNSVLDEVVAECTAIYVELATHELRESSQRDSLTGLLNHEAFNAALDEELDRARRYGHELQVIFIDFDEFKEINDHLGHAEGDRALEGVARLILESVRDSDLAGRVGGDEFAVALVESGELAAHVLVDRLRQRIAHARAEDIVPAGTSISAGCAAFPAEADGARDLLVLADRRLYEDKRVRKATGSVPAVPGAPAAGDAGRAREDADSASDDANLDLDAHAGARHAQPVRARPAMRMIGESVVVPVEDDDLVGHDDEDPAHEEPAHEAVADEEADTERVVEAARAAIRAARERAGMDPVGDGSA